jgi:predicted nucleotidyltransferase component of viral defense system
MNPHYEAITPEAQQALIVLAQQPFMQRFYLAGGTALALQIGHRVSYDLDFFSWEDKLEPATRAEIAAALQPLQIVLDTDKAGMIFARLANVKVSFIYQHHPLLEPLFNLEGVHLASLIDIGLMKLAAINDRGARRDYVDLYCMRKQAPLARLLELAPQKYFDRPSFTVIATRALCYFDDAENDPRALTMLQPVRWSNVKKYCVQAARLLTEHNIGLKIRDKRKRTR